MTEPTYLLTEAKREQNFAEWIARDMGDAFVASIVLEKNIDGTYSQGMTRIKFNAFCAGLQSLPMVTTTPKAYILQNSEDSHKKLSWVENDDCENIPLFTSPQALTPITAADVTDEMLELVHKHRLHSETEIIVAVFNSVAAHLVKHRSEAR